MGSTNGTGGGPPAGSHWDNPNAETMILRDMPKVALDPAHPAPSDPLKHGAQPGVVYRQVPIVTVQHDWGREQVRHALRSHSTGLFEGSAQLVDSILGDPRIQATLGSRVSGLFGQEVIFTPANDSDAAKEVCDAWRTAWPKFATSALVMMHTYAIMMGFAPAQILWDTSGPVWTPQIEPWHPRFVYYDWGAFRYQAISQDGVIPIVPGDGKWMMHAPWGTGSNARSWMRGAVRGVAEPWIERHESSRDHSRYNEVHGMPARVATVPAASDQVQRDRYQQQLENPGREMTIMLPKGVDGAGQDYGFDLVEAEAGNWQSFVSKSDRADMDIVLAILFQNLTTEVTGGSFAATSAHMDIRSSGIQADNGDWKLTVREQAARPFASINFGDADLAPWTSYDVQPLGDWDLRGNMLNKFAQSIDALRRAGVEFDEDGMRWLAMRVGVKLPRGFKIVEPVQVAAAATSKPEEKKL